ncbi:MAG: hypothetical protein KJ767_00005, partial [Nanoarchaeota archaeon]|nr:hypothetical protein [Nanoarchaeota archaeon]
SYSERGTYTVALRVHDGQEYSEIVTQEITIYDYQIDFTEDWNLISLPEVPEDDDTSIESVFDDVLENINIIWSYQMGEWKVYSEGPQDLTDIIPGYGYYVDVNDDVTSYQNGEKMYGNDGWTVPKPPVVTLTPSWNLIGHYGMNEGLSRAESFTTIEGYYATILDVNGMPTYEFYPTEGYWLFLTGINNMDYAPSDAAYDY